MAIKLEKELTAAGCHVEAETFRQVVIEIFNDTFGNWTDEDLLCRPSEALRYCNLVRETIACESLDDYVILRTLTNVRKHGNT